MLSWYQGDFSNSELEKDYSNLFSQYVVKVKDNEMNAYNVLKQIVGDDNSYPATVLTDMVGKKTGVFEMGFPADNTEVLKYAYEQLKLQQAIEILKIKTLNYKKVDINVNECVETILKPFQNFYEDFNINFSTTPVLASGYTNGMLQKVGYVVGYSHESSDSGGVLDFNKQKEYVNACDRSMKINKIIVYYLSTRSVDQFKIYDSRHSILANGNGGMLNIDVNDFDKRDIKVELLNLRNRIIFLKMRCYFIQGSKKVLMNVREMNYKYSKGSLNIDLKLSPLRSVLTGHMHERDQKIKQLEKLLTNPSNPN